MKYLATCPISIITTLYEPNQISVIGVNETTLMQLTRLSDRGIHSSSSEIEEGISSVEGGAAGGRKQDARPRPRCALRSVARASRLPHTKQVPSKAAAFPRHLAVRPTPKLGHAFIRPNHGAIFIMKKRHFKKEFQPAHLIGSRPKNPS